MIGGLFIGLLVFASFLGLIFFGAGGKLALYGVYLMMASGLISSASLLMFRALTPSAFALLDAKLRRKTLLLIWLENGVIKPYTSKFESGFCWIRKRLGYLVSSSEDRGFMDGVPTYLIYWGVGKTLNPKAMADITLLEKYGISMDYLSKRLEKSGVIPVIDVSDEGELVEVEA